jgi:hypothetical protein
MNRELLSKGPRIKIMVGEFGSGKTEFAINYAMQLQESGVATAIVDIDLVKPYFRTRESRNLLEHHGVRVVAPEQKFTHSDLPIMPQDLSRVLYDHNLQVVMDVGGGESAIVLGQLNPKFRENPYRALLIVNTRRPFTNSAENIIATIERIEKVSRLKIGGLVSNTNLAEETTPELITAGISIVEETSRLTGLPLEWVVVPDWLAGKVTAKYPIFILKRCTQYPWMD